jgi:hypothetical protein
MSKLTTPSHACGLGEETGRIFIEADQGMLIICSFLAVGNGRL